MESLPKLPKTLSRTSKALWKATITDATTILSNAIEKVKSAGGGEVLIPEGTFKISNWKVLDGTHAGVTIRRLGPTSILKVALPDAPQGGRGRPPCSLLRRI